MITFNCSSAPGICVFKQQVYRVGGLERALRQPGPLSSAWARWVVRKGSVYPSACLHMVTGVGSAGRDADRVAYGMLSPPGTMVGSQICVRNFISSRSLSLGKEFRLR